MKIYDLESDPSSLQVACEMIRSNGIIAFPTDTVYGLCASFTKVSISKLHKIRKRPLTQPFLLAISENYALEQLVAELSLSQKNFINQHWPGKITLLLPKKKGVLYPPSERIALRKPDQKDGIYFYQLLDQLQHPLLSTSINMPGEEMIDDPVQMNEIFSGNIDAYFQLQNKSKDTIKAKPSQIWDITEYPYRRIR